MWYQLGLLLHPVLTDFKTLHLLFTMQRHWMGARHKKMGKAMNSTYQGTLFACHFGHACHMFTSRGLSSELYNPRFNFRQGQKMYLFSKMSRPFLGPTQHHIQQASGVLSVGEGRLSLPLASIQSQGYVLVELQIQSHYRFLWCGWGQLHLLPIHYKLPALIYFLLLIICEGSDKSLAQTTSQCCSKESIVLLERGVCSCAELQVFSCYRG